MRLASVGISGICAMTMAASACREDTQAAFRLAVDTSEPASAHPAALKLSRAAAIGEAEGSDPSTFSNISAVVLVRDRSIYVVDPLYPRIEQFDANGRLLRKIGRKGAGPGEFLVPTLATTLGAGLAVYDQQLNRITFFDSAGTAVRTTPLRRGWYPTSMNGLQDGSLLLTPRFPDTLALIQIDSDGQVLRQLHRRAVPAELLPPNYRPPGGLACQQSDSILIWANAWTYEIVGIDARSLRIRWSRTYRSDVLRPIPASGPLAGSSKIAKLVQGAGLLGLVCDSVRIMLAYGTMNAERRITYDLLGPTGDVLQRAEFVRDRTDEYPGYLGAMSGSLIATFRTKPFPEVFVYDSIPTPFARDSRSRGR